MKWFHLWTPMKQDSSTAGQPGTDGRVSGNDKKPRSLNVTNRWVQSNGAIPHHKTSPGSMCSDKSQSLVTKELCRTLCWVSQVIWSVMNVAGKLRWNKRKGRQGESWMTPCRLDTGTCSSWRTDGTLPLLKWHLRRCVTLGMVCGVSGQREVVLLLY